MTDEDDKFRSMIGGSYGTYETQLGHEAYQSQVDYNNAQVRMINTQRDLAYKQFEQAEHTIKSRNDRDYALAGFWNAMSISVLICAIPLARRLWRSGR